MFHVESGSLLHGLSVVTRLDNVALSPCPRNSRCATNAPLSAVAGGSQVPLAWAKQSLDGTFEAIFDEPCEASHCSLEPHLSVYQSMTPLAPGVAAAPLHLLQAKRAEWQLMLAPCYVAAAWATRSNWQGLNFSPLMDKRCCRRHSPRTGAQ